MKYTVIKLAKFQCCESGLKRFVVLDNTTRLVVAEFDTQKAADKWVKTELKTELLKAEMTLVRERRLSTI